MKVTALLKPHSRLVVLAAICGAASIVNATAASADLKVLGVTVTPTNPQVGDTVQYRCFVRNDGPDTPASMHGYVGPDSNGGDTYMTFDHGNPQPFFTDNTGFRYFRFVNGSGQTISTLSSGQTCYFDAYYKVVQAGTAQRLFGVTSDDSNTTDPNQGNNSTTASTTISSAATTAASNWVAGRDMVSMEKPDGSSPNDGTNNKVPEWSYGFRSTTVGTGLTLFSPQDHVDNAYGSLDGWQTPNTVVVFANTGSSDVVLSFCCGPLKPIAPGSMVLHPGSDLTRPVVRWTAPAQGSYAISAQWQDLDDHGGNGASAHVVINGQEVFGQAWANGGSAAMNATSFNLNAGDVVDFVLDAEGDYNFDNTGFDATISPVPPPPPHGGLSATTLTVNGRTAPLGGEAGSRLNFAAQQAGKPAGLQVRVQATTTPDVESSWTDLTDGRMTYVANLYAYIRTSTAYPAQNGVWFRAISSAGGYADSISNKVGPFDLSSSKPALGKTKLRFTGNGPLCDLYFRATESNTPSGISVRVQSTTSPSDESSWTDLNDSQGGQMTQSIKPTDFLLLVNNYAGGTGIYFRAIASAPGFADSISNIIGPLDIAQVVPPTVNIVTDSGLSGSGNGDDPDHPIILPADRAGFGATVQSPNALRVVQLQVDGQTVTEYKDQQNAGSVYVSFGYTPAIGDHVYEAVAVDKNGARARIGTGAKYVRVIGAQSTAKAARAPNSSAAAATAIGHVFHVVNSGGDWYDPATWNDENGAPGVPGQNDFAIIGSSTVQSSTDVVAGSVSLSSGGMIGGPGTFDVYGTITLYGGKFVNSICDVFGTANLVNPQNVDFGGRLINHGTFNIHGSGGLVGADEFANDGTINWLPALQIAPDASVDPAAAFRILQATVFRNSGIIQGNISALIGNDGSSLIGNDGASLVAAGGGNLVAAGGGNLIGNDGASLIGNDGASLVAAGGGNLVAAGGGNVLPLADLHEKAATAAAGFTQTAGEAKLGSFDIIGQVVLDGGVLSGNGFIQGDLTNNSGYVSPGHSAGVMAVAGSFAQGANGTTIVEVGGPTGGQFDSLQVGKTASLGGKLDVKLVNGYKPDPNDTFNVVTFASATGSFAGSSNSQVGGNGTGVIVNVDATKPQPSAGQPLNISTRMEVLSGENVLIAGFIVTGAPSSTKKVLIRGLGPSLPVGSAALADPLLEFHNADGSITTNDDWKSTQQSDIEATGIPPSSDKEAALVLTIPVGSQGLSSCTAILKGAHGETGIGLVEVYDLEQSSAARLANISTRGFIDTGDNVMIGGFIVGGGEPANMYVRAVGPSLQQQGVNGAIADPMLELHDANGAVITNDDWRQAQESEIIATTIPPASDKEPGIVQTLAPGNYTAVVRGKNGSTGVGLVEAYNLP